MKFPVWPEQVGYRNIELGLDRVYELLSRLRNPHQSLPPTIHVAGTNGKGSTLAYLNSILTVAGYKVHQYISPHLVRFNERIILAGKEVDDNFLNEVLAECKKAANSHPKINVTFFEAVTAAAFLAFSKVKADVLLLETGMGGRLDATNVVDNPLATVITSISFDHTEFLGNSLAKIAFEKAGIIKQKTLLITARQKKSALEVIKKQAEIRKAPIYIFGKDFQAKKKQSSMLFTIKNKKLVLPLPALIGGHQLENAANAIAVLMLQKKFKINFNDIAIGLVNTKWKARLEKVTQGKFFDLLPKNYQLFLDGSHNIAGAKTLAKWIKKENKPTAKIYLVCGMLDNKDTYNFLKYLFRTIDFLVGIAIKNEPKSKTAEQIVKLANELKIKSIAANNFKEAIKKVIVKHNSFKPAKIIICGSLYLAGNFLEENGS